MDNETEDHDSDEKSVYDTAGSDSDKNYDPNDDGIDMDYQQSDGGDYYFCDDETAVSDNVDMSDWNIGDETEEPEHKESYLSHRFDNDTYDLPPTQRSFWQRYLCRRASSIGKHGNIETSDKIIMPQSALEVLSSVRLDYPMLFEIGPYYFDENQIRVSHCGVWEFTAEEGFIYMPDWMMENLKLQEGQLLLLKNKTLDKGTHVKLQPHTKDFFEVPDQKVMLEAVFRTFTCLTTGDTILLQHENKKYYLNVVETKPSDAICIIDTDPEVDFALPLDYKEPEKTPEAPVSSPHKEAADPVEEPKFSAFSGVGRRLDGKPLQNDPAAEAVASSSSVTTSNSGAQVSTGSSLQDTSRRHQGKLVYGRDANSTTAKDSKTASKDVKQEQHPQGKEKLKFQAFMGKKYSLS